MRRSTEVQRAAHGLATLCAALLAPHASAQVVFDDTFGNPGPAPIEPGGTIRIDQDRGGTVSSGGRSHLFHSFEEFGVGGAQIADFRTDDAIDTILARVTGANPSDIAGAIRVRNDSGLNGPDLFLLNPNGVLFGGAPNAVIDMDGAFFASTASFVGFEDGARFEASDITAPLPSTAAPPSILGFDALGGADIEVTGQLRSTDSSGGQKASSVSLVARNLRMQSGRLFAKGATVQLAAVGAGPLDVPVDVASLATRAGDSAQGSILIGEPGGFFDVNTTSLVADEGRIVIRGGELVLSPGRLSAGGDGSMGAETVAIDIELARRLGLAGVEAKIESRTVQAFGPGAIRIVAQDVDVLSNASIEITNNGPGTQPARLAIEADRVTLDGASSEIVSTTSRDGTGGDITIHAGELRATNEGGLFAQSAGTATSSNTGDVGNITIEVDRIGLASNAAIVSTTTTDGRGGDITIRGQQLTASGGAQIVADSQPAGSGGFGRGATGDITIEVVDAALTSGADVLNVTNADGDGGDVVVRGERLTLTDFARIAAASNGTARGGDVEIRVADVQLDGGSQIGAGPVPIEGRPDIPFGPAGSLQIVADELRVAGGSQITTTTEGLGDAGDLTIDVSDSMVVEGAQAGSNVTSGVFARSGIDTGSTASGNGGALSIRAGRLEIRDGAEIGVQAFGSGDAGEASIAVDGTLRLSGGVISGRSTGTGVTGVVRVSAGRDIRIEDDSAVLSDVPNASGGGPSPGDIEMSAGRDLQIVDSRIRTDSIRAESGNIHLHGRESVAVIDSSVATNIDTVSGQGGDIEIRTGALGVASSAITANANDLNTDAGNILLVADDGIVRSPNSPITADASLGVSGRVSFNSPDTNLAGELGVLASDYRDDREAVRDPCQAKRSRAGSLGVERSSPRPFSPDEPLLDDPLEDAADPLDGCATP